jgi:hypothetical protein
MTRSDKNEKVLDETLATWKAMTPALLSRRYVRELLSESYVELYINPNSQIQTHPVDFYKILKKKLLLPNKVRQRAPEHTDSPTCQVHGANLRELVSLNLFFFT